MARARASTRGKAKGSTVRVNFKGVESRRTPPEGDYILEVLEATSETSSSGNDQIKFVLEISKGEYKGAKVYFYCPLQENSLWKLHAFLTAMGEEVPEDDMDIDLSDMVAKEVVGVLTHEMYNGRKQAKMTDFDSVENYTGDADDDKKSGKDKKEPKTWTKAGVEDMDSDELDEVIEEAELTIKGYAKLKKLPQKVEAVLDALEEEERLAPEPKKSGKGGGKETKKKTYSTDEIGDMDEDELAKVIKAEKLKVDLDDYKKLTKKAAAVVDALEENDQIDDDD